MSKYQEIQWCCLLSELEGDHSANGPCSLVPQDYAKFLGIVIDFNRKWKHQNDLISLKISKTSESLYGGPKLCWNPSRQTKTLCSNWTSINDLSLTYSGCHIYTMGFVQPSCTSASYLSSSDVIFHCFISLLVMPTLSLLS